MTSCKSRSKGSLFATAVAIGVCSNTGPFFVQGFGAAAGLQSSHIQRDSCSALSAHESQVSQETSVLVLLNPRFSNLSRKPVQIPLRLRAAEAQDWKVLLNADGVSLSPNNLAAIEHFTGHKTRKKSQSRVQQAASKSYKPKTRQIRSIGERNPDVSFIIASVKSYEGRSTLLNRPKEATLSGEILKFVALMRVKIQFEKINGRVPTDEEWAASVNLNVSDLREQTKRSRDARTCFVSGNVGLVVSIAKRYTNRGLAFADLVQEGSLGLMEAAERFDSTKGFKFCTYASWWIRQRITRSIADYSRVIRLPEHVHTTLGIMHRTKRELTVELGRLPTNLELASKMNISMKKLKKLSESSQLVLSLEIPASSKADERRTLRDGIASDSPTPEDHTEADLLRAELISVMGELAPTERDVLMMRFGLDDG
mmetsp:Transcript_17807/g.35553  ORF Transcript_17807/g.35553 Transcript_17807/m.35553 type:complete len:426 (+) Transcript_17807:246-1523(+)